MLTTRKQILRCYYWRGLLTVVLAVAVIMAIRMYFSGGRLPRDSYGYIHYAETVADIGFTEASEQLSRQATYPPLLTILMVALMKIGFSAWAAGILLNQIGVLTAVSGVFSCPWRIWRKHTYPLFGTLLIFSLPIIYDSSYGILRDSLFWGICCWIAFLFFDQPLREKLFSYFLLNTLCLGILCGTGGLCRKEGLFVGGLAIMLWTLRQFAGSASWHHKILRALSGGGLAFIISILLLLLPWVCGIPYNLISLLPHWWEHL